MPPRKRKATDSNAPSTGKKAKTIAAEKVASPPASVQEHDASILPCGGESGSSTDDKAMLSLPPELVNEILKCYPEIVIGAEKVSDHIPVLGMQYLERTRVLRSLSQVCRAYRNAFLPLLWETIHICCCSEQEKSFYKKLGDTMIRYAAGLEASPALKPFIRSANLVFTRYKTAEVLPPFARCLESLPNLRTIHIIHTHTQMTTALKTGFENVTLSNIRTIIGPGNCHEILKRCPNVTTVWCTTGDGSTLVGVMRKHCPNVEELRVIKACPKLRILDIQYHADLTLITQNLPFFKFFHTIIARAPINETGNEDPGMDNFINHFKAAFKKLPSIDHNRKIRIHYEDWSSKWSRNNKPPLVSFYKDVEMDE
ncbi:hypothetical protein CVT24_005331 [Panaeolus cyanescens]|uniref:Uncharacterized protein n=1 Tax=Panaeolus cyanescens TaxID=181874 RepID=A0A409Y9J4_9AGAR|nr:hypothetical protein CVT24_005331 [Panaeolus cyanescens]